MSRTARAATVTIRATKPRPRIIHRSGITYCYLDAVGIVTVIKRDGSAHRRTMTDYEIREHEDQVKRIALIREIDEALGEHERQQGFRPLRGLQIIKAAFSRFPRRWSVVIGLLLGLVAVVAVVDAWR